MRGRTSWIVVASWLLVSGMALGGCAARAGSSQAATTAGAEGSALPASESGVASRTVARPSLEGYRPVAQLPDIHFDFDKYDLRNADALALEKGAQWLKDNPSYLLLIEGHADERGTNEYNLALGERRAKASKNYLVSHGVKSDRVTIISYGEERPICAEKTETCWAQNRRAHFAVKPR